MFDTKYIKLGNDQIYLLEICGLIYVVIWIIKLLEMKQNHKMSWQILLCDYLYNLNYWLYGAVCFFIHTKVETALLYGAHIYLILS